MILCCMYTALQSQNSVSADLKSEQILPFDFAGSIALLNANNVLNVTYTSRIIIQGAIGRMITQKTYHPSGDGSVYQSVTL